MSIELAGPATFSPTPANETLISVFVPGVHALPYGTRIVVVLPEGSTHEVKRGGNPDGSK